MRKVDLDAELLKALHVEPGSTRARILVHVLDCPGATMREISYAVQVDVTGIHYHAGQLQRAGLVVLQQGAAGRGRGKVSRVHPRSEEILARGQEALRNLQAAVEMRSRGQSP